MITFKKYQNKKGDTVLVSDNGGPLKITDKAGMVRGMLPRYAVWEHDEAKGKLQVKKTGNDLDRLIDMKEYYNGCDAFTQICGDCEDLEDITSEDIVALGTFYDCSIKKIKAAIKYLEEFQNKE